MRLRGLLRSVGEQTHEEALRGHRARAVSLDPAGRGLAVVLRRQRLSGLAAPEVRWPKRLSPAPAATIETARLRLRPMTADDAGPLLAIFGDPRVMAAFDGELFDQAQMDRWVGRNLAHQAEHGYGLYS